MGPGPASRRRHVELVRIGLGVSDQFEARRGRNRRMHHHDEDVAADGCDRRDVAEENEREVVEEGRVDCAAQRDHDERIAIRRRSHDRLHGDIAAGAGSVVDDELLAEALRQPLADEARIDVVRPTGGEADDNTHRSRRIALRPSDPRHDRHSSRTRGQVQKPAAGKFHDGPLALPRKARSDCPTRRLEAASRAPTLWPRGSIPRPTARARCRRDRPDQCAGSMPTDFQRSAEPELAIILTRAAAASPAVDFAVTTAS
jgi:hypothetical protein